MGNSSKREKKSKKKHKHKERKEKKKKSKKIRKHQKEKSERATIKIIENKVPLEKNEPNEDEDFAIPVDLMDSKSHAPETPEEYQERQNRIRREIDPSTGRSRLIKGDGEILEEIVSKERHKAINKQATKGDGNFFQENTLDDGKTENHNSDNDEETEICQLNASLIDDGLTFCKSMVNHFLKNYPNMERALEFALDINNCITGYKELYKELKKPKVQLSIKIFLINKSTAQDLSESSPTVQNSITRRKSPLDNLMDISVDDTDFSTVRREQLRLLLSSDE